MFGRAHLERSNGDLDSAIAFFVIFLKSDCLLEGRDRLRRKGLGGAILWPSIELY
jgi:hypothetical protein